MLAVITILSGSIPAFAGATRIVDVKVECNSSCTFSVTLQHADEGWNHYADHWLILDKDEQVIAARKLMHPHVKEQPFTRSLSYIEIPDEITEVTIRAHCSVDNYSGKDMTLIIER